MPLTHSVSGTQRLRSPTTSHNNRDNRNMAQESFHVKKCLVYIEFYIYTYNVGEECKRGEGRVRWEKGEEEDVHNM